MPRFEGERMIGMVMGNATGWGIKSTKKHQNRYMPGKRLNKKAMTTTVTAFSFTTPILYQLSSFSNFCILASASKLPNEKASLYNSKASRLVSFFLRGANLVRFAAISRACACA